jgi:hypothetical protein
MSLETKLLIIDFEVIDVSFVIITFNEEHGKKVLPMA